MIQTVMENTVILWHIRREISELWSKKFVVEGSGNNIPVDQLIKNFVDSLNQLNVKAVLSIDSNEGLLQRVANQLSIPHEVTTFAHEISILKGIFLDNKISYVYYIDSIFPLLDIDLTEKLFRLHNEYSADYSFVENAPPGICGVFFNRSLFEAMEIEQNEKSEKPVIDSAIPNTMPITLREYIEKNINHFHVEIHYEHPDLRILRLDYSGKTERSIVNCMTIFSRLGKRDKYYSELSGLFEDSPLMLHNFPSYLELEINGTCEFACSFCARQIPGVKNDQHLSMDQIRKILEFSRQGFSDTAFALGGQGEPLEHPDISEILELILSQESIPMLIIETNAKYLDKIISAFQLKGSAKLRIVININSLKNYEKLHGTSTTDKERVMGNIDAICTELDKINPGLKKNIYIQTLKILENSRELDEIYYFCDQKGISFLLQKYNSYIGLMPEKRVSDMTPLDRSFCWHLRRDMYIRSTGDVIFCKQDVSNPQVRGNINQKSLSEIWNSTKEDWKKNYIKSYPTSPNCAQCDEYYTYNM